MIATAAAPSAISRCRLRSMRPRAVVGRQAERQRQRRSRRSILRKLQAVDDDEVRSGFELIDEAADIFVITFELRRDPKPRERALFVFIRRRNSALDADVVLLAELFEPQKRDISRAREAC